jgi:ABC-type Fe3+-siderophore transport system permease subunit
MIKETQKISNTLKKVFFFSIISLLLISSVFANVTSNTKNQNNTWDDNDKKAAGAIIGFIAFFYFLWFAMFIFFFIISIAGLIFWIFMLIDCIKREFGTENEKIIWILVLALTGAIGAIVYYFLIKKKDKPDIKKK